MKNYLSTKIDFTGAVDVYDELPIWSAPFGLKLLDFIHYRQNIKALDIGFGAGFPITEIAMRLGESSTVYGIDPWKEATERVRRKITYYGISNINLIEGIAEAIPLESGFVDLVTSNNGINNVKDMDQVIKECSRILKTGGQFVQTLNLDLSMIEFYSQLKEVLSELNLKREIELLRQHIHQKRKPLKETIALLQKHGFAIQDLEHDQFNYRFANATAMFNHCFIRLAFMPAWLEFLPRDKASLIFETVESRMNILAKGFGEIKLSIPFVLINARKL